MAMHIAENGGEIRRGAEVSAIHEYENGVRVESTSLGRVDARRLIACAGLQSDRIASMAGLRTDHRIVPFQGRILTSSRHPRHA